MARRSPSNKRKQRERKWIDEQLGDDTGRAEGQMFVVNMETGEKTPGLNSKEAKALWRSLPRAIILSMDDFEPGRAPLKATYVDGPIPQ